MPCITTPAEYPPSRYEVLSAKCPAMLCALIRALGGEMKEVLPHVDWKEAGVTQNEFIEWWQLHKQGDETRKANELAARQRAELRKSGRAKLSPAERDALGLRGEDE